MQILPPALQSVIDALGTLPGVGPRTAERYAYFLLKSDYANSKKLASSLDNLHEGIDYCEVTFALIPRDENFPDYIQTQGETRQL